MFPIAVSGKDVLVRARTGTGKTLSFVLPLVQTLLSTPREPGNKGPRVIVLSPTRELAKQVIVCVRVCVCVCVCVFFQLISSIVSDGARV